MVGQLKEQAEKREAELQQLLNDRTAQVQATERKAAEDLAAIKLAEAEKEQQWASHQHSEE